ncbi:MAG: zf-HC2 domain-containing protein [Candidatus Krumholzibacteria bacterium]|nr:zf-HC2 domain-containing protein [Candidatus Krumholzibacteria bacterium]
MNSERIEAMLSAYAAGELTAAERAEVEAALARLPALRESLAAFTALEETLVSRREQVPPAEGFLRGVFAAARAAAPSPHPSRGRLRRWLDAATGVPAVATYACLATALAAFVYRDALASLIARLTAQRQMPSMPDASGVTDAIVAVAGGEMWVLAVVYAGVTALIVLSLSLVTMRFVREG